MNIVADIRKFRDHCGNDLWGIIKGTRVAPLLYTAAEEAAMSAFEKFRSESTGRNEMKPFH
jgi:hypothetical protein